MSLRPCGQSAAQEPPQSGATIKPSCPGRGLSCRATPLAHSDPHIHTHTHTRMHIYIYGRTTNTYKTTHTDTHAWGRTQQCKHTFLYAKRKSRCNQYIVFRTRVGALHVRSNTQYTPEWNYIVMTYVITAFYMK